MDAIRTNGWAKLTRRLAAMAGATVLCAGIVTVASAPLSGATTPSTYTGVSHHRPHFIRAAWIESHFFPLDVASAQQPSSDNLSVSKQGQLVGGRAQPSATPEVIPAGVVFDVSTTADTNLATDTSTVCTDATGACSLRAAIEAADNLGEQSPPTPATIDVPAGTYTLTLGQLYISDSAGVTINGAGESTTVINSNGTDRVLEIAGYGVDECIALSPSVSGACAAHPNRPEVTGTPAALNNLTVSGGDAARTIEEDDSGCGGGIDEPGDASVAELTNVDVSGNSASEAGGGICASGTVYATSSTITDNSVVPVSDDAVDAAGGGVMLGWGEAGAAVFNGVTVSNNTVNTTGIDTKDFWFGAGGGIAAVYGSILNLQNSAVNGNSLTSAADSCYDSETMCGLLTGGGVFDLEASVSATSTTIDNNAVQQLSACADYCEYGGVGGGIANFGGTSLTGVTIDGNTVSTGPAGDDTMDSAEGGGIDTYEPMVLTNSTVDGNTAIGADDAEDDCSITGGAGIFADTPGFVMTGTTVSANTLTDGSGAGVVVWDPDAYNDSYPIKPDDEDDLFLSGDVLSNDVISNNSSTATWGYAQNPDPYDFGSDGGLYVETGTVQMSGLDITGNTAATWGGGFWTSDGTLAQVSDTTIADNTAYQAGGAIVTYGSNVSMTNSTVADNTATGTATSPDDDDFVPAGGGIYIADDSVGVLTFDTVSGNTSATTGGGLFELENDGGATFTSVGTIVGGNQAAGAEQDCATAAPRFLLTSGGWNLDGDATCNLTQPTDQVAVAPDLGALANNGGPAPTMLPNTGSPVIDAGGTSAACPSTDERGVSRPQGPACDIGAVEVRYTPGYWIAAADGGVFALGGAPFLGAGNTPGLTAAGVVGIAPTPDGGGYWLVSANGAVQRFGDAKYFGSLDAVALNSPVVGMAPTPDGGGYWLVASDGGVFSYGDAAFWGSEGGQTLNKPIVGMAATPDGGGYWLVASDGGIFSFGDAAFWGSEGGQTLNKPIVGMAATPGGGGYWLVASDGGIFSFGNAPFEGSAVGMTLHAPIVGMSPTADGAGYWLVGGDGGVFSFGDAPFGGSLPSLGITITDGVGITAA